ncbi:uncharacterized protein LOC110452463 isoform X2 [Mizuhopecten yessoensis]|uniref:uncharacterized protein LOC110452463 isoform X2 n=1 Tax=Mizuhopecten yessoensis TaxID=6573 RepID=UPI000B45F14E|nr:uncharacterized protein LOC110452463 isoform X2 [Mizuhopecten yessoensis]
MLEDVDEHVDKLIFSGSVVEAIDVICDGTGIKVNTSNINAPVTFKTVTVPYHELLTMILFDNNANNGQKSADTITVGGNYTLQIKAKDNVDIHVQSCTASPVDKKSEMVQLYFNGKPDSTNDVLTTFDETEVQTASATMTGFRFIGKDSVLITCTVDVTTPETTIVPSTTPSQHRRRRNAFQLKHKKSLVVSTSLRVESLSTNGVQAVRRALNFVKE